MSSPPAHSPPATESDLVAEADERELELRESIANDSLMDFVPWCTPKFKQPVHLARYVERLQRALLGEPHRVVVHAPPQHTKTDTTLHGFAWGLKRNAQLQLAYATYGDRLARKKSRRTRNLVERCGVPLATTNLNDWTTEAGGGLLATGVCGPLTGFSRIDVLVIDDPYKNRIEAESPVRRQNIEEWFDDVVDTRTWPTSSVFCFMTRWHPDDLAGYLIKNHGFEYICLPALNEDGTALWPEGSWPADRLRVKQQRSPYSFASLFQGSPRPRGASVFGPPTVYTKLPIVYRAGFGVDLSYSAKTSSDWSVIVKLLHAPARENATPLEQKFGIWYVTEVVRRQCRPSLFKRICRKRHRREPSARWLWYSSTTETGTADLFTEPPRGVPLEAVIAKGDKYTRALPVAEAWNAGLVRVPASAPWLDDFLEEVQSFTGVNDAEDDQVDSLAAAFDVLREDDTEIPEQPRKAQPVDKGGLYWSPM